MSKNEETKYITFPNGGFERADDIVGVQIFEVKGRHTVSTRIVGGSVREHRFDEKSDANALLDAIREALGLPAIVRDNP